MKVVLFILIAAALVAEHAFAYKVYTDIKQDMQNISESHVSKSDIDALKRSVGYNANSIIDSNKAVDELANMYKEISTWVTTCAAKMDDINTLCDNSNKNTGEALREMDKIKQWVYTMTTDLVTRVGAIESEHAAE